jgi:hypothetical protein
MDTAEKRPEDDSRRLSKYVKKVAQSKQYLCM